MFVTSRGAEQEELLCGRTESKNVVLHCFIQRQRKDVVEAKEEEEQTCQVATLFFRSNHKVVPKQPLESDTIQCILRVEKIVPGLVLILRHDNDVLVERRVVANSRHIAQAKTFLGLVVLRWKERATSESELDLKEDDNVV